MFFWARIGVLCSRVVCLEFCRGEDPEEEEEEEEGDAADDVEAPRPVFVFSHPLGRFSAVSMIFFVVCDSQVEEPVPKRARHAPCLHGSRFVYCSCRVRILGRIGEALLAKDTDNDPPSPPSHTPPLVQHELASSSHETPTTLYLSPEPSNTPPITCPVPLPRIHHRLPSELPWPSHDHPSTIRPRRSIRHPPIRARLRINLFPCRMCSACNKQKLPAAIAAIFRGRGRR